MNEYAFDALAQRAAREISRRASLATLGAAGLAASLAVPVSIEAKKKKCKKKKCKKCPSAEDICGPQVEDCVDTVTAVCGTGPECGRLIGCCEAFADCDVSAFLLCLNTPPVP